MRIGTCGCGTIASWISDILDQLNEERIVRYAAASNIPAQSRSFAAEYGWQKACDSYDALLADPEVDVAYICVPNPFHYELVMQALNAGKNVICEKPFAVNDCQAEEMLTLAEEKGLFITEALWPEFLPSRSLIDDEIAGGSIGAVTGGELVQLSNVMFMERIRKLELGGGALLDMGPYVLGRMTSHFGLDEMVKSLGVYYIVMLAVHIMVSSVTSSYQSMVIGAGNATLNFIIGILDGVVCKIGLSLIFVQLFTGNAAIAAWFGPTPAYISTSDFLTTMAYFWGTGLSRVLPALVCMIYFYSGAWKRRTLIGDER